MMLQTFTHFKGINFIYEIHSAIYVSELYIEIHVFLNEYQSIARTHSTQIMTGYYKVKHKT